VILIKLYMVPRLILLDTSFIFSFLNNSDYNHKKALEIMRKIDDGEYGKPLITDYIFDELVTLVLIRGGPDYAVNVGNTLLEEVHKGSINMHYVTSKDFERAWGYFQLLHSRRLSFTDCVSLAVLEELRIDYIASFDRGFDGVVINKKPLKRAS
jgi:predicted nucleic acid-binding protein